MSSALDAAQRVLTQAGEPLHYREIAKRGIEKGYWKTDGKTPEATVNAQLAIHIKKYGPKARFCRTAPGMYGLTTSAGSHAPGGLPPVLLPKKADAPKPTRPTISFTDAAEEVLTRLANRRPMYYRDLAAKALELGLVATTGRTPESTLYASVLQEIQRYQKRGEQPRFHMHGKGMIGLAKWMPTGIPSQIEQHNKVVRKKLHEQIRSMDPGDFEDLIGRLLAELGFDEVTVTVRSGDGGIDVRGTLVVGDVIRTRMAVQVKRWKPNVQAPVVQQVRGSLGTHEHGLIITTSDFSSGARDEAARPDAVPVGLMDGDQLVTLLIENNIGVRKSTYDLIELGEASADAEPE